MSDEAEQKYAANTRKFYLRMRENLLRILDNGTDGYPIIEESDNAIDDGLRYAEQIYAILFYRQMRQDNTHNLLRHWGEIMTNKSVLISSTVRSQEVIDILAESLQYLIMADLADQMQSWTQHGTKSLVATRPNCLGSSLADHIYRLSAEELTDSWSYCTNPNTIHAKLHNRYTNS